MSTPTSYLQIVDSTTSCKLLLFLDAYSGYHQISLAMDDKEKTSFIKSFGIFCYTKMAFGLRNEGGGQRIRSAYTSSWKIRLREMSKPTFMI
jgi:hypothetical protein